MFLAPNIVKQCQKVIILSNSNDKQFIISSYFLKHTPTTSRGLKSIRAERQNDYEQSVKTTTSRASKRLRAERQSDYKQSVKTTTSRASKRLRAERQSDYEQSVKTTTSRASKRLQAERQNDYEQSVKATTSRAINPKYLKQKIKKEFSFNNPKLSIEIYQNRKHFFVLIFSISAIPRYLHFLPKARESSQRYTKPNLYRSDYGLR
ncbi:hypothetical protein HW49_06770 [Porphyromonadaceae bacterium COT-184 OH4590]|nr:hypothetical protein HW49_06770 [Porphyromonadaceae bacterium COT-184 OH4590]